MARKDYVRSSAPKRRPGARQKKAPERKVPWLALVVLVVAVVAFGAFLVNLAKRPDAPQAPAEKPVATDTTPAIPAAAKTKEQLPTPPKEQWRYVDALKNKEVKVEVPPRPKSTTLYQMQCGSFKEQHQAEEQKAKLAFVGLEAKVLKTGDWYRVVLGPYKGKRAAQNDSHKAEKGGIPGCAIWTWR